MKSQEDSYAQLVEVWSNPALILHSDTREVLAQNSSVSDVFGQEVEWLKIGDQDWQSWWKNPTGKQLFQLKTSSGKSRGFFVRSGALKGVDYIVFEDQLGWRELRNAFEVNKVRYQGLAAGTMEGLAFMQNHQIIDLNTEMMRILGISKLEELAELDVQKLFGPRNWKKMYSRAGHVQEFEFVGLNGKDLVVEGKIELVGESNHSNEVECTLALMDITERKRVEHDLLQTKERFRLLVETSPFGLFLVRNSEVGYANAAALELLGC